VSEKALLRTNALCLEDLKKELGPKLRSSAQVTPPAGVPTGWPSLDRYLLWQGFPKSAVTLMVSEAGGATSLWIRSASAVTQAGQWAAWVNNDESSLAPWMLRHRGVDLAKLLVVSAPKDEKQLLWAMQELMSLCLFEVIGCDLGRMRLREHQILKLKKLAMRYQTAAVLINHDPRALQSPFYSLILHFEHDHVTVNRALHRSPTTLERRDLYADTLPLLAAGRRALCG
jgi:recA bacterial DNA recombination protein